jgi:hypothetical protein
MDTPLTNPIALAINAIVTILLSNSNDGGGICMLTGRMSSLAARICRQFKWTRQYERELGSYPRMNILIKRKKKEKSLDK